MQLRILLPAAILVGAAAAALSAADLPPLAVFLGAGLAAGLAGAFLTRSQSQRGKDSELVSDGGKNPRSEETSEQDRPDPELSPAIGRLLIEKLPVPLLIITQRGRLSYANLAAETTLQMISKGQHFAHIIRAPAFIEAVTATLEDGLERSFEFQAYEGGDRYFEARVSRLSLGGVFGPEDQAIVQVEDRTQTHRAEMLRSDFIANASHELRTPLASIVGYIETLQNHAKEDADARERFLEIMGREAHRMQRLVDELMSLSRIELNEHVRPVERVSLNRIAADCAAVFRPFAQKEGVEILVEIENGDAEVIGDSDQLAQVFTNLIDNAMKYGGEEAQICIQPAAESPAHPGRIGVSVSDTGIGIPKDKISRLTERFYRVNVHQSRNKGGTGLGLAIVKHILNRHRGRLEIVSVLGEGSTFTVWLPKADLSTDVHVLRRDAGRDVVPPARRMPG